MKSRIVLIVPVFAALLIVAIFEVTVDPSVTAIAQSDTLDKIEPLLLAELETDDSAGFFVWMTEKADLSPASGLSTKDEKGRFVYHALRETAERTQKDLRRSLDLDGVEYRSFYIANKILVLDGSSALALDVASRSDVAQITADHTYQLDEPVPDPGGPLSTLFVGPNISFVRADDVWALGVTGTGAVLAGNDTGLDEDHPAIARHYRGCLNPPQCTLEDHNYNWWDATGTYPTDPWDGYGHGTHTTGTMVGDDGGPNQIGMAPGARTIHCKNMRDSGSGSDLTFTECFQWDLAPWDLKGENPRPDLAPDAVNNSWGYSGGNSAQFKDEIAALQAAGIVVEASAGNEANSRGCQSLRSPGDYQEVLTTGSVDHSTSYPGDIVSSSSRGPSDLDPGYFPDVMAPGLSVRSSVPGSQYESWSGTSMAGPHVTGLVGLIWSACPALRGQVADTMQFIKDTAVPLTGQTGMNCGGDYVTGPNHDWGHGTIDSLAAVSSAVEHCVAEGFLAGQVSDSGSLAALEGAVVNAELISGGQWSATTDLTGLYGLTVPVGTYTVTAQAFGYVSDTVTSVVVETNTVTTQDFSLSPATRYVVSGTLMEAGSGLPLDGQVSVLETPLAPAHTDPSTGYYSTTVPEGSYTFRATAPGYQGQDQLVVADHDQTQNFALDPLPCFLLVDDDNDAPDVRGYYTSALTSLGFTYDAFEVQGVGSGPSLLEVEGYSAVIWFSGDNDGPGPNAADETTLSEYLEGGGRLFLSSQDYLWARGLTDFGSSYLGMGDYVDDIGGAATVYPVAGSPLGSDVGPYPLSYPQGFSDFADVVDPGDGAAVVFSSSPAGGNNLDVTKAGASWRTVFFGTSWVPIQNHEATNGEEVLRSIARWFEICGESRVHFYMPIILQAE